MSNYFLDRGDQHWRVGKVYSITGGSAVVKLLCEPGFVRNITVTTSDLPVQLKGAPLAAKVTMPGAPSTYTIDEMVSAPWGSDAPRNESASIDRNDPCWPEFPDELLLDEALGGSSGSTASLVHQASVSLTHPDIIALPSTAFVVAPDLTSESRSYFMVGCGLSIDATAGNYTNVAAASGGITAGFLLGAVIPQAIWNTYLADAENNPPFTFFGGGDPFRRFKTGDADVTSGAASDRDSIIGASKQVRMQLYIDNYDSNYAIDQGIFTGGHADNWMSVSVMFWLYDEALRKFLTTDESGWDDTTRTFA